jgi:hypothetical protein
MMDLRSASEPHPVARLTGTSHPDDIAFDHDLRTGHAGDSAREILGLVVRK